MFMCWGKGRIHENLGEMGANNGACLRHVMCLSAAYGGLFYKEKNLYCIGANPLIPSICTSIYSSLSTFQPLSHLIFTNASKEHRTGINRFNV